MNLKTYGKSTLGCEITNITKLGIWVYILNKEYFIPYSDYPIFETMPVKEVFDVKFNPPEHLYWENLDLDIELSALEKPEKYPLKYRYYSKEK